MKRTMRFWGLVVLAAAVMPWLVTLRAHGQAVAHGGAPYGGVAAMGGDTLELHFRLAESDIDLAFADNSLRLDAFMDRLMVMDPERLQRLYIKIYTGASPEGPAELNRRLGERRGVALRQLLAHRMEQAGMNIMCSRLMVVNEGARWGHLYRMVEQSREPWRDSVLTILRRTPQAGGEWLLDEREEALRRLQEGTVWAQLRDRYLPPLRSVGTAVLTPMPLSAAGRRDTLVIRDTVYYMPYATQGAGDVAGALLPSAVRRERRTADLRPCWSLKSSLLLLAAAVPNMQGEWSLGRRGRWSLCTEVAYTWFTLSHNAHAEQLLYGSLELRHWLGNRQHHSTLSGWHLGLAVAGGYYDLEWQSRGYQGEAVSGFLNIGWQHRYGQRRQWCVDIGVGIGLLSTRYRYYQGSTLYPAGREEEHDDHLMWQRNGRLNWPGAVHANISVGYVFTRK